MLKGFLLVGIGSFLGGGLRFLVSRMTAEWVATPFPLATFAVNIIGCLVIGFVSGLPLGGWLSADTRLILTTRFLRWFHHFLHVYEREYVTDEKRRFHDGGTLHVCQYCHRFRCGGGWSPTGQNLSVVATEKVGEAPLADTVSASFSRPLSYRYATI